MNWDIKNIKIFIFVCFSLLITKQVYATHYRAGEISYVQLDDLTIKITLTSYTKLSSIQADRDSVEIRWGDGTKETVPRNNALTTTADNDIKISYFTALHTYPGRASYTISFTDPNRTANILNVNAPNSVDIPFYIETTFSLLDTQFEGKNSSVILLEPPIDIACVGQPFIHNPNAYDPDGDSLSYEIITPLMEKGTIVPNYQLPSEIVPGGDNNIWIDNETGTFYWDAPKIQGEYNIAFRIKEYRKGVLITSLVRDMQILVKACNNAPPSIDLIENHCVVVGEEIRIDITIDDPNDTQLGVVTASGGILELPINSATLENGQEYQNFPFTATLIWTPTCIDIRKEYYHVVIKATDNGHPVNLSNLKTIKIKVLGPPPITKDIKVKTNEIQLTWEFPYDCENAQKEYFQGFSIWRKEASPPTPQDSCREGIIDPNYKKIKAITKDILDNEYYYYDTNIEDNKSYCYRILGEFALSTTVGYPYNQVSSLRSDELCATTTGDIPTLIQTSVNNTGQNNGSVMVQWIAPNLEHLDTSEFLAPYRYQLTRSIYGENDYKEIVDANFNENTINSTKIYKYLDQGLSTNNTQYDYQIDFYTNNQYYKTSKNATTIYLTIQPTNNKLHLSWEEKTPWVNTKYKLWKYDPLSSSYSLIDSTFASSIIDTNVVNGQEYCYKIESKGYFYDGIRKVNNITNYSQEACAVPIDNEPPCIPVLWVDNICDKENVDITMEELSNYLHWNDPNETCDHTDNIDSYNIYYKNKMTSAYHLIITISANTERKYHHFPTNGVAGCYTITAIDSNGNESNQSTEVCVDNCPLYELPNSFTPNGDLANDLFKPTKNYFIEKVDFKLYNRWEGQVFQTSDPEINWDGTNKKGKEVAPGVYYYICQVYESRINESEVIAFEINGIIHLIREKK